MVVEWIKDERGEAYIPRRGTKITCNGGIVLASVALNDNAYNKLLKQINDKQMGKATL